MLQLKLGKLRLYPSYFTNLQEYPWLFLKLHRIPLNSKSAPTLLPKATFALNARISAPTPYVTSFHFPTRCFLTPYPLPVTDLDSGQNGHGHPPSRLSISIDARPQT